MEEQTRNIVVAVDYGTTHSSVAWMHPEAENNVQFVDNWPGGSADTPTRVPSRIAYPDDNPTLEGKKAWGHEVTSAHVAASWIKLLLEPGVEERVVENNNNNKRWLNSLGIFARPGGRAPSQIVQDFLNLLRNHAEAQIKNRCTARNHAILPFAYVFTVPATWSEKAITTLKQAARKAGCHGIDGKNDPLVIPEPEAALTTMIRDPGIPIQEGDGVAICDCGGGTLDIGIYVVHRKATGAYMAVRSHTDLQGGSTTVDRGFYTAASEGLVKDFDQLEQFETSPTSVLMIQFELAKRNFQGTIDPDLQELRYMKNGKYFSCKFTSADMLRLQSPVITRICSVLEDNISRGHRDFGSPMVKHVYVSGATARSIYLRGALEKIFANSLIDIRYPEFPQNVVAGGAALWAYDRLRLVEHPHHHYGIETPAPPEGAMDVDGNMPPITWVLRKGLRYPIGEPIGRGQSTVFPCQVLQAFPFSVIKIYDSGRDVAPDRVNPNGDDPNNDVRIIGHLFCDFTTAVATGKVRIGQTVQIDVRFIIDRNKIHVKAESPGVLYGELEIDCFY